MVNTNFTLEELEIIREMADYEMQNLIALSSDDELITSTVMDSQSRGFPIEKEHYLDHLSFKISQWISIQSYPETLFNCQIKIQSFEHLEVILKSLDYLEDKPGYKSLLSKIILIQTISLN